MNTKRKVSKFVCLILAIAMLSMSFMSLTAFAADTEETGISDDVAILCDDCDHADALIAEEAIGCTSILGHRWVSAYETMSYENTSVKATYCYFREIYRRDFETCSRCGVKTASTYYYWKVESKYHTWSGNTCTGCGYKK